MRFIVMDTDGTQIDTISAPVAPADFDDDQYSMRAEVESGDQWISVGATVPFSPDWYWTVHPTGHFLSALSTAYQINLEQDDGVLRIERNHTPVAVLDDERDRHEQRILSRMRQVQCRLELGRSRHTGAQAALQGPECWKRWPDLGEALDGGAAGRERGARPEPIPSPLRSPGSSRSATTCSKPTEPTSGPWSRPQDSALRRLPCSVVPTSGRLSGTIWVWSECVATGSRCLPPEKLDGIFVRH